MLKTWLHLMIFLCAFFSETIAAQSFELPLEITNGKYSQVLTIGMHEFGSSNLDPDLDVLSPPAPPAGAFDARLRASKPSNDFYKDIRQSDADTTTFAVLFQIAQQDSALMLKWDSTRVAAFDAAMITDNVTGELFAYDMKEANALNVSGEVLLKNTGSLRIVIVPGKK